VPVLLSDPGLAYDALGSFFAIGREECFTKLLGVDEGNQISHSSMVALIEEAVHHLLEGGGDISAWTAIAGITGDLPPYTEIIDQMSTLLATVNYNISSVQELYTACLGIRVATAQAIHFNHLDNSEHLWSQLLTIAGKCNQMLGERDHLLTNTIIEDDRLDDMCQWVLEAALNLALVKSESHERITAFTYYISNSLTYGERYRKQHCQYFSAVVSISLWKLCNYYGHFLFDYEQCNYRI